MAFNGFENVVLENKMTDLVNTQLDVNALFTVDDSLKEEAGLSKVINKYTYTGAVEELEKGAKNTQKGSVSFIPETHTVKRYQQTFEYNDMDIMQDPYLLDVATTGAAQVMANEVREAYFDALSGASNVISFNPYADETFSFYDLIVDALAELGREVESDMFIITGLDAKAQVRKDPDFKSSRQGEIIYTGQFGTIAGIPCLFSKLVNSGLCYITAKDQVKFFVKKEGSVEQDRDIETKDNTVVYERHGVMALVDETKTIKLELTFKTGDGIYTTGTGVPLKFKAAYEAAQEEAQEETQEETP